MTDIRAADPVSVSRDSGLTIIVESGPLSLRIAPNGLSVGSAHGTGFPRYTSNDEVMSSSEKVELVTSGGHSITLAPEVFMEVSGLLRALPACVAARWFKGERLKVPPMLPTRDGYLPPRTAFFETEDGTKHVLAHPEFVTINGVDVALSQNREGTLVVIGRVVTRVA